MNHGILAIQANPLYATLSKLQKYESLESPPYEPKKPRYSAVSGEKSSNFPEWWARLDLNQRPIGYEPTALTS